MEKAQKKIDLGKTLETARELLGSVRFMFFETLLALLVAAFRSEVVGAVLFVVLLLRTIPVRSFLKFLSIGALYF